MLISICGSQGSGKSTLIDALSYNRIERKTSRSILADWGVSLSEVNNNHELTIKFQDEILKRKLEDEKEAVQSNDLFITERTYADLFVYALVALGKDNQYDSWINEYFEKCKSAQDSYSGVFYLTAGHFKPVADGVRGHNQHYSRLVDLVLLDYTIQTVPPQKLQIVDHPNIDVRAAQVEGFVKSLLESNN
jgi:nicotinamide riboside kinase